MPWSALLTATTRCVIQTFEASARSLITRPVIIHVYIIVAITRHAFAAWPRWITVEARRAPLTKLSTVAGLALTIIDFTRSVIEHAAIRKYIRVSWSRTWTHATFSLTIAILY